MAISLKVSGMSCQHCVKAVKEAVSALEGVESCSVDLEQGLVTVDGSEETSLKDRAAAAIKGEGYAVADA